LPFFGPQCGVGQVPGGPVPGDPWQITGDALGAAYAGVDVSRPVPLYGREAGAGDPRAMVGPTRIDCFALLRWPVSQSGWPVLIGHWTSTLPDGPAYSGSQSIDRRARPICSGSVSTVPEQSRSGIYASSLRVASRRVGSSAVGPHSTEWVSTREGQVLTVRGGGSQGRVRGRAARGKDRRP
jgi:hypothetical protein